MIRIARYGGSQHAYARARLFYNDELIATRYRATALRDKWVVHTWPLSRTSSIKSAVSLWRLLR